jgi:hypothetical protein
MFALDGPGRHLWAHDIILSVWQFDSAAVARVACWRGPWGANVLLLDVSFSLERASASLEGAFTLFASQLGF